MYLGEEVMYGGKYTRERLLMSHICFKVLYSNPVKAAEFGICTTLFPSHCCIPRLPSYFTLPFPPKRFFGS